MEPMDRLSVREEMDARLAKKLGSGSTSKPLVLTQRILKPAEKRVLVKLKDRIKLIKHDLDMEKEYRSLNPEDHPVRDSTTKKQKQESLRREEGLRMQLKATNRMVSNVKAGALIPKSLFNQGSAPLRGGGGTSGLRKAFEQWNDLFTHSS